MKRIIISGAGGFLATNVIGCALSIGLDVVAITSKPEKLNAVNAIRTEEFLKHGYPCNIEDAFIHCLFPTNANGYKMADGLEKAYHMVDIAHDCGIGAFVNISSQSVYNPRRKNPAVETDALCLDSPYAVGKYSVEAYVNKVFVNVPHTNVRLASLIGVGYEQRIVNRMISQALRGEKLTVVGGMQKYGFLNVRDAAEGIVELVKSDWSIWKAVYNLGGDESYTLCEVAKSIASEVEKSTNIDVPVLTTDGDDCRNSALNASRFMHDFDWQPRITLIETIRSIIRDKLQ